MADDPDPLVHLSAIYEALQEASEAIAATALGVEQDRAQKASSAALAAPNGQSGPPAAAL